ncbi:MAG: thermonuclease family protein, partial [Rhodospirillaceae bacterium]|nr:thermonuclease family protein [Rhodospirillaceae bacterium]
MVRILAFILPLAAFALSPSPASQSAETLAGPVPARLLRVIDGDTIAVSARIWLGQAVETLVRVDGVDTPELKGKCAAERKLARRARGFVIDFLSAGGVT